ncbi:potassium channel subfamily K member 18 [Schistocerca serialis cubense]|uniref:potassium channel subfamily K member 18 n=1 Tax=Schistocerca serialis cubense TaxID=2023355 RepID=UPI00214E7BD2|nr:potassium channel subfamily K member 18 [Schistocerca serialis cubense]
MTPTTAPVPAAEGEPQPPEPPRPTRRGHRPRITLPIFHLPPSAPSTPSQASQHSAATQGGVPPHQYAYVQHQQQQQFTAPQGQPPLSLQLPPQTPGVGLGAGAGRPRSMGAGAAAGQQTPLTPGTAGALPIANPMGPFGIMQLYPTKASEFMFKQFAGFKDFTMNTAKSGLSVGEKVAFWLYNKVRSWSKRWFTHMFLFAVVLAYSLLGAMLFVAVEGTSEERALNDIRQERYKVIRELRELVNDPILADDEKAYEGQASRIMRDFELHVLEVHGVGGLTDTDQKVWTFWNAVFYCGTIYTTIGYGHISPKTTTGRAITIVYAIFGIPLFLILLADFGKLFTRAIKFLWAFVRRLYYTGSCKRVRRTAPVQEVWKGVQLVYDFATFRRPSQVPPGTDPTALEDAEASVPLNRPQSDAAPVAAPAPPGAPPGAMAPPGQTVLPLDGLEPGTPAPSAFEVDDEFNLPISIAIFILLAYIFVGAAIYFVWEDWGFFESFYFVFISMSTIGFGDFVPQHPMYMMASIVYLVFGLALTSMCINVVQIKLSDSFRQASAKLGATIGLRVTDEDGVATPIPATPVVDLSDVQPSLGKSAST